MSDSHSNPADNHTVKAPRSAAINTLAIVGFLALIFIGIGLAIYSSQFVPGAVNQTAVNSGTNTNPATQVGVIPTNTTIPFVSSTTTVMTSPSVAANTNSNTNTNSNSGSGLTLPQATQIQNPALASAYTATNPAPSTSYHAPTYTLSGLPNLTVNVVAVGYLADGPNSPFVASPVIPVGALAAIQFTIGNTGTNSTGPWNFIAQIPTDNGYTYQSPTEQNMNPGDHILYTLSFNQVAPGDSEPVNVIADPRNYLQETTKSDNVAHAVLTVARS